jgi:hypothetical protein
MPKVPPTERVIQNRIKTLREFSERWARLRDEPDPDPNRIPPTRQTLAKRQRSPIQVLHERGAIGPEEVRAAVEINDAFHAIVGALFPRAQDPSREGIRTSAPKEDWPKSLRSSVDRYKAWAYNWSARFSLGGPPVLAVCIDIIVDGRTCCDVDSARRWRKGRAADLIREGLEDYARRAGWRMTIAA